MTRRRLILPFLALLFASGVGTAQLASRPGNLKVRVTFTDGHPCTIKVRVQLMLSAGNTPVGESYTNDQGETEFDDVEPGNYHVVVTGDGIESADTDLFEVDNRRGTQFQTIIVRRTGEGSQKSGSATVALGDMNIPKAARKQFNKATDLITREEWNKAIDQLKRALALYPNYVQAYNNLGVVYARMDDRNSESAALQKAINVDDHFAPAWVNLARLAIADRDFAAAESELNRAISLDPANPETLLIRANVELMNLHYQQAIADCQKVHSFGQDSHSLVHFIAARAYEHENEIPQAISELHTFLKEEPSGVRADAARKELATLQKSR